MLNNKGQSLVLFIIIIPLLLGLLAFVADVGNVIYYKQDMDNINKIVINYGLDNMNDSNILNEMKELAKLNNSKISMDVSFNDMEFYVSSSYYVNGMFSSIFNIKGFLVKSTYKGYKDLDKNVIKKIN